MLKIYKNNWIIITILILAFLLRIIGINYGLPNFFVGDEQSLIAGALKMGELKTLIPAFHPEEFRILYYPPIGSYFYLIFLTPFILIKYLIGGFSNLFEFKQYLILNHGFIWFWARIFTAAIGTATIYLIYLIGKKIFNKKTAIFSSLFLTFSFFHLQLSHFTRHWVLVVFFFCLTILFSFFVYSAPKKKYYLLAGLFSGLAFGVSYVGALSILFVLMAHFLKPNIYLEKKIKDRNLWLMILIFLILMLLVIALCPQEFLRMTIGDETGIYASKNFISYLNSFYYYFKTLIFLEPMILIFSLIGFVALYFKEKRIFYLFSVFIFLYITVLYLIFHNETRYIIFVMPFLSLASGFGLFFIIKNVKFLLSILLLVVIFLYPFLSAIKYDFLLSQKDTRILAKEWIENNLPPGSRIISNLKTIKLIPTKEAIKEQEEIDHQSLRNSEKALLLIKEEKYPRPAFYLLHTHFISEEKMPDILQYAKENNYQYFIISYWDKVEILEKEKRFIQEAKLIKVFFSNEEKASYNVNGNLNMPIDVLFSLNRLGPIVEIYKLY